MHGESARRRLLSILQPKPARSAEAKQICSRGGKKGTTLKHLETALVTIVPGAFTAFFKTDREKQRPRIQQT